MIKHDQYSAYNLRMLLVYTCLCYFSPPQNQCQGQTTVCGCLDCQLRLGTVKLFHFLLLEFAEGIYTWLYMERFFEDSRNLNSIVVVLWTYHSDKMCKRCGMRKEPREQHEPDFVAWTSSKHLEGRGIEIYWAQLVNVAWFGRNKQYNSSFQYEQSKDALTSCEFVEFVRHFNLVSCDFSCRMCSICTERTS